MSSLTKTPDGMSNAGRVHGGGIISTSPPNPPPPRAPPPPAGNTNVKSFKAEFFIMEEDIPAAGFPSDVDGISIKEPVGIKVGAEAVCHKELEAVLLESIRKKAVHVGCTNPEAISTDVLKKLGLRVLCTPYAKKVRCSS